MFGLDRTFLSQSSALEMLSREGMDFNHLLRHGIRYLSRDEETEIRTTESNREEGLNEDVIIDEGGQKFLATTKFSFYNSSNLDLKSKNGFKILQTENMIFVILQLRVLIIKGFYINLFPLCFRI
jgi:CAF1 family ribonuclease